MLIQPKVLDRNRLLSQLKTTDFDLLVIGGGITGCGIALDAATRGLKVALLEKSDFASGTSSKSTKLIHGGLRYLKQMEFGLVREVGSERAIVHKLAPHLVLPEKMLLPLVKGGSYGKFMTALGLGIYDLLAGVVKEDRRKMLSAKATAALEPLLRTDILEGGGYYAEYRTDDARLTTEIMKTAIAHEAVCLNYVQVDGFLQSDGKITGVNATDVIGSQSFKVTAKVVVNAAGPWVDDLRELDGSKTGKHLFHSKGVHIVVPYQRLPLHAAVYFDTPDGRMVFAIPRQGITYIGTTDTAYQGSLNEVSATVEDVEYLLKAANHMFPTVHLRMEDVQSSWAGLRPLIFEPGKKASEMSRKDEIFESGSGLISIAGGKLTGYRKMAARIVDRVIKRLDWKTRSICKTDKIPLTGGPFADAKAVEQYKKSLVEKGLSTASAAYLTHNYGKQSDWIVARAGSDKSESELARAELAYCLEYEGVQTALDYFNRRSGRLYFQIESVKKLLPLLMPDLAAFLHWDQNKIQQEEQTVYDAIRQVSVFQPDYQNL